jgi:outer membrane protein assembly factor BamE (lipoprotein component of BamABCDE complex)
MKKLVVLLVAGMIGLAACASTGMRQDCLERKKRADRVAAIAAEELKPGWTAQEVRSALGEPDEIVTAKGVGDFDIWKYYLFEDCKAHLGMTAPLTELFFLNGNLIRYTTYPQ